MAGWIQTDWLMDELGASTAKKAGLSEITFFPTTTVILTDAPHECDVIQRLSEAWRNLER